VKKEDYASAITSKLLSDFQEDNECDVAHDDDGVIIDEVVLSSSDNEEEFNEDEYDYEY
jgi:hypothetical protein